MFRLRTKNFNKLLFRITTKSTNGQEKRCREVLRANFLFLLPWRKKKQGRLFVFVVWNNIYFVWKEVIYSDILLHIAVKRENYEAGSLPKQSVVFTSLQNSLDYILGILWLIFFIIAAYQLAVTTYLKYYLFSIAVLITYG